jgi:hypothetical protein
MVYDHHIPTFILALTSSKYCLFRKLNLQCMKHFREKVCLAIDIGYMQPNLVGCKYVQIAFHNYCIFETNVCC